MVKTQWKILLATFLISCISFALLIIAITTPHWISGWAIPVDNSLGGIARVQYGLMSGTVSREIISSPTYYDLKMTCLFSENICMQSCQPTQESREREVLLLLLGKPVASSCDGVESSDTSYPEDGMEDRRKLFINSTLYVSLWVFLGIAIFFSFMSLVFSAVNIMANPVINIFSTPGLHIWNSGVAVAGLITLILWAVQFSSLKENLAIQDTLRLLYPFESSGKNSWGYSAYMILGAMILHGSVNTALLYWRRWMIRREPEQITIPMDKPEVVLMY